jgi:hypothetical protein
VAVTTTSGSNLSDINPLSIHFGDLRLALLRKASKDASGDRIDGCIPLKGTPNLTQLNSKSASESAKYAECSSSSMTTKKVSEIKNLKGYKNKPLRFTP